jgi:nitric oxide reductase subunit C
MPKFNFSEEEKDQLVQFFKEIDQTGHYPDVMQQSGKMVG